MTANYNVIHGDCLEELRKLESNSYDAICSDPPAGIAFMQAKWDADKGGRDHWIAWLASIFKEALRCLKPGAYGLVWALPRTSHWTAMALEIAGFEIRDRVSHLFATGFPKSMDLAKSLDKRSGIWRGKAGPIESTNIARSGPNYERTAKGEPVTAAAAAAAAAGYGTALKPACEDWWLIRKPLEGTTVANALKWGTGAINVDGCRIGDAIGGWGGGAGGGQTWAEANSGLCKSGAARPVAGRWPANVTFDEDAASLLDEQAGDHPSQPFRANDVEGNVLSLHHRSAGGFAESGGPSRFFFVAKSSTTEREMGCEELDFVSNAERTNRVDGSPGMNNPRAGAGRGEGAGARNSHPTIKSIALTQWLATLILPPPRADGASRRLLCPFAGSGGEMIGGMRAGFEEMVGIEQDARFVEIAKARLARWAQVQPHVDAKEVKQAAAVDERQISLF